MHKPGTAARGGNRRTRTGFEIYTSILQSPSPASARLPQTSRSVTFKIPSACKNRLRTAARDQVPAETDIYEDAIEEMRQKLAVVKGL